MQHLKDCLLRRFHIKDIVDLKYVLGIEFSCFKDGVYMSQRKYGLFLRLVVEQKVPF